jgi:flavin-dependent dehydrogenase
MKTTDVLVIGGGPAGAATALACAASGTRVTVVERSARDAARVGETLPPDAAPLLRRLGIWECFVRDGHLPSPGVVSAWGDEQPYESDFIFSPYGSGWHVDRRRFDAMLATAAEERGAVVHRDARVLTCSPDPSGGWRVEVQSRGQTSCLRASFVVDATGRASWLSRRLGARRLDRDRLVGVVGVFSASAAGPAGDPRLLLEAAEHGWWYSALMPNDRLTVAYMTDRDLLPQAPRDLDGFWSARRRQTTHTRRRLGAAAPQSALRIVSAESYRMDPAGGADWLAVGDAAMAWDPLSSQGVRKALESAFAAADTAGAARAGLTARAAEYVDGVARDFERYCRLRAWYYGQVWRWPGSLFWKRRQVAPGGERSLRIASGSQANLGRKSTASPYAGG